jgi:hypothetical protein
LYNYIKSIKEIVLFRYIRLALPRSNVRKWKFRLKTFREVNKLFYFKKKKQKNFNF